MLVEFHNFLLFCYCFGSDVQIYKIKHVFLLGVLYQIKIFPTTIQIFKKYETIVDESDNLNYFVALRKISKNDTL